MPPLEFCFGTSPIQAESLLMERPWVSDAGNQSGGQHRPDAGNLIELSASCIGSVPGRDHTIRLQNCEPPVPAVRAPSAAHMRVQSRATACHLNQRRHRGVARHRGARPARRCRTRQDGADRIDHGGLLTHEQMTGAMERQAALLLGRLCRYEPHVWPGDRFADCLGVSGIVLLSLDVRLHHRPAASNERCGRVPGARATNDARTHTLQCQPGTAGASGRMSDT